MAISEAFTNSATISTTEYSLPNAATYSSGSVKTDDGVYQVIIDFANLTSGEIYAINFYEKATSGGTVTKLFPEIRVRGAQNTLWVSPSLILLHGWDVTVTKVSGTDRSISWSIRKVA